METATWCPDEITVSVTTGPAIWLKRRPPGSCMCRNAFTSPGSSGSCKTSRAVWSRMSVRGGFGIWERWCEVGGWAVVTVVRNVGTTVSPIVVLPRVVLKKSLINKERRTVEEWIF